jgi:5'-nucleotidase
MSPSVYQQAALRPVSRANLSKLLGGGPFAVRRPHRYSRVLEKAARSAPPGHGPLAPAHERVIRTLREWNIRLDESFSQAAWKSHPRNLRRRCIF